jgi:anti-sigma factor RsiW
MHYGLSQKRSGINLAFRHSIKEIKTEAPPPIIDGDIMESSIVTEKQIMRYLLGNLSETEQAALEEAFITSPQVFTQVVEVENDLIDDYVRGRLAPHERERFERYFLASPSGRRVRIAEALLPKFDQAATTYGSAALPAENLSGWRRFLAPVRNLQTAPGLIAALAALLIAVGGAWFFNETRRLGQEVRARQAESERRERELTRQIANERQRSSQLADEIERLRSQILPQATPSPSSSATAFATLFLVGGALRDIDTGDIPRLVISPGVEHARLVLKMEDSGYPDYRAELQSASGEVIWSRGSLKPRLSRSVATFTITLPAVKFTGGTYTLTVSGISKSGDVDVLSKSSFRVEKKSPFPR